MPGKSKSKRQYINFTKKKNFEKNIKLKFFSVNIDTQCVSKITELYI